MAPRANGGTPVFEAKGELKATQAQRNPPQPLALTRSMSGLWWVTLDPGDKVHGKNKFSHFASHLQSIFARSGERKALKIVHYSSGFALS